MGKEKLSKQNIFSFMKNAFLKPVEKMEDNLKQIKDPKETFIFAGIVALLITVLNLLMTMLNSLFVKSCDFWTGKCKTKFTFSGLDNLDYGTLIFKYFLITAGFVLGAALIYYIVALVIKKNSNYVKILGMSLIALLPNIALSYIVGPILGIAYSPLNLFANMAGMIYTAFIMLFVLKEELKMNDIDKLVVYNLISVTLVYALKYFIFTI